MSQLFTAVSGNVPTNVPTTFHTDAGDAIPAANILNVLGAGGTSTAGAGNTVTITTVATILPWTNEASDFTAVVNNGYFCTAALTATIPAGTQGQVIIIEVDTASTVVLQCDAGQSIRMGQTATSVAGTATSTNRGDTLYLVYKANTQTWNSISTEGTWLLA